MTTLDQITQTLIDLRKQAESSDMNKAHLFAQVKAGKLYVEEYGTFADYCESIGYTRQFVYMLIRIHQEPQVQQAQPEIGTFAANAIVSVIKHIPVEIQRECVCNLVNYAKEHTAKETSDRCQQEKLIHAKPEPSEPDTMTLAIALAKQTKLLQRKSDLEAELDEINKDLSELYQIIKELSA